VAVAFLLVGWVSSAWAYPPTNPYLPTGGEIVGMLDRTADYSGGTQASTGTRTPILDGSGVMVEMNWRTGTPAVNETFTRYVLAQRFPEDNGDGDGADLEAFDGVAWMIQSTVPVSVKPYSQSWDNFAFREGTQNLGGGSGIVPVPANTPTLVAIDWDEVTGGSMPASDRTNVFEVGFQVFGPSPPQDGTTVQGTMWITAVPIPEPASICGVALAAAALLVRRHA
jgi:hypothetical protein